jgi:hypothetical protein
LISTNSLLTRRQEAYILTIGYVSIMLLGVFALVALLFMAIWLVCQFCFLLLASVLEAAQTVAALYQHSPDVIKLLLLAALAYGFYRAYRAARNWKRGNA